MVGPCRRNQVESASWDLIWEMVDEFQVPGQVRELSG